MTQINCAIFPLRSFSILHRVFASVVHNCLFTCVRTVLIFWIIYVIVWLSYFLQSFGRLLHWIFRQIIHICIVCFDSFLPVPPPRLSWRFCRFELHFAGPEVWVCYTFVLPCLFSSVCALSVCLWRILLCHCFLIFAVGWFICVLILLFRLVTSFLFLVFTDFMYCLNRSSFLIPLCSSPAWSLHTTILFANMVCFLAQPYFVKHVPITHFGLFFLVFSSLPWLYTPLHSSLSIIILSHSLFTILHRNHKTSCPGKFPRP